MGGRIKRKGHSVASKTGKEKPDNGKAKVVAFINQKGGVGKSTKTVNTAATTAQVLRTRGSGEGKSPVAAVSIDPQGSAVWWSERVASRDFHIVQAHDDIEGLRKLRELPGIRRVFVDTPGWIELGADSAADAVGDGRSSEALKAVLSSTDLAIVPMTPEPLSYPPTVHTIEKVLQPRGIPFMVVINNWDPRDGRADLDETIEFVQRKGWPLANTVIRRYKLHTRASADGQVVTEYPRNRVGMEARADFSALSHEIELQLAEGR